MSSALRKPPRQSWLLDRDNSPWYPTARLFRQPRVDDWESVILRVHEALSTIQGGHADAASDVR